MRIHKSLIAAVGLAAFAAAPAFAGTTADLSATTSAATGATTSGGSAAKSANFGQVISSIQASKNGATQIQGLTTVKHVNVVKVSDIATGGNKTALDQAVTKNEGDITSLRTAMSSNTAVNSALAKAKVDVSAVVAANISGDGELTVYVR
jgi:hypothetical protein